MNAPIDDHSHRSALPVPARSGFTGVLRRYPWAPALLVLTVVLLWFVSRFYSPQTGFTSMLTIGDQLTPSRALREQHPYVFKDSCGYDGQAYVQIALDPLLRSPDLVTSVDSLGYRARRIFMPACAWLAGLGRPAWVVQAYALSNVAGWLLLGLVLLRWLPPDSPGNVFRWAGILFSHGLCTSLRCSLTDGPGLALLALGLLMLETGRLRGAIATFAATILSRETYVLNIAAALTPERFRDRRAWLRAARLIALATLPLLLWIVYVRLATGAPRAAGSRNFALPAFGYFRRWHELLSDSNGEQYLLDFRIVGILSQVALTVQVLFLFLRPRFGNAWWRAGAASAALGLVLGPAVWEGFPGSALRVLLPVTVAFNLLVPKGRKWLPILILGNLTILGGLGELRDAPIYFAQWQVERGAVYSTVMDTGSGWYPPRGEPRSRVALVRGLGPIRLHQSRRLPRLPLPLWRTFRAVVQGDQHRARRRRDLAQRADRPYRALPHHANHHTARRHDLRRVQRPTSGGRTRRRYTSARIRDLRPHGRHERASSAITARTAQTSITRLSRANTIFPPADGSTLTTSTSARAPMWLRP